MNPPRDDSSQQKPDDPVARLRDGVTVSAARAVIQTGEYDFGWNIQVEDDVLLRLEKGGKGKTVYAVGGDTEFIALNFTDPNTEVDGERSSMKTKHPLFSDPAVRKALSMLVDREAVKKVIYGRAGRVTPNFLNGPEQFVSKNTTWECEVFLLSGEDRRDLLPLALAVLLVPGASVLISRS